MKKSFKTIMALTAALSISMSGVCITSADKDPPPPTTQSVADEDGDGNFDSSPSIPVTMNAEHVLSVTIDFGAMAMNFDLTDTSAENDYGWGNSFNGINNKLTVTNNSTCPVSSFSKINNVTQYIGMYLNDINQYSYYLYDYFDAYNLKSGVSFDLYVVLGYDRNNEEFNAYDIDYFSTYNFNNAKICEITISLKPEWETL